MVQEFITGGKKSKDFGYSFLKVPSKKVPSKEVKRSLHTDEFSWSKKELDTTPRRAVTKDNQAEQGLFAPKIWGVLR